MKVKKFLVILLVCMSLFVFAGCTPTNNGVEYEIDTTQVQGEIELKNFNLSLIKINVKRPNEEVEIVPVDETMISLEDSSKLTKVGTHEITISYKFYTTKITITLVNTGSVKPDIPDIPDKPDNPVGPSSNYYSSANGKSGMELKMALRQIISKVKHVESYNDLKTDLPYTDEDPNRPGYMKLIYSSHSVKGRWDSAATWNREHVWPQSRGWFKTSGAGADLHHLRPEDPKVNSNRGNRPFSDDGRGGSFVPPENSKGDVARIIFYLLTRYSESDSYKITNVATSYEMLLRWNRIDPVDDFERQRNERSFEIQGNRNPFIDHPEACDMIWGNSNEKFDSNK